MVASGLGTSNLSKFISGFIHPCPQGRILLQSQLMTALSCRPEGCGRDAISCAPWMKKQPGCNSASRYEPRCVNTGEEAPVGTRHAAWLLLHAQQHPACRAGFPENPLPCFWSSPQHRPGAQEPTGGWGPFCCWQRL